jgi:hypothetical protein
MNRDLLYTMQDERGVVRLCPGDVWSEHAICWAAWKAQERGSPWVLVSDVPTESGRMELWRWIIRLGVSRIITPLSEFYV